MFIRYFSKGFVIDYKSTLFSSLTFGDALWFRSRARNLFNCHFKQSSKFNFI